MDYLNKYKEWLTNLYFDESTRSELAALQGNAY